MVRPCSRSARSWWAQRRVDGVFLVNLQIDDRRIGLLEQLRMPTVVIGDPAGAGSLPAVWQDDAAATRAVVEYLARAGHRGIARVTGIPRFWHTKIRTDAFRSAAQAVGARAVLLEGDYPGENGAAATRQLLRGAEPPTAIVYDNDLMAVSGLGAAQQAGVEVPAELSIVALDDSAFCEVVHPPLTALTRDVPAVRACGAGAGPGGRGRRGGALPGGPGHAHGPRQHRPGSTGSGPPGRLTCRAAPRNRPGTRSQRYPSWSGPLRRTPTRWACSGPSRTCAAPGGSCAAGRASPRCAGSTHRREEPGQSRIRFRGHGPVSARLHWRGRASLGSVFRRSGVWGNWQPDGFWPR